MFWTNKTPRKFIPWRVTDALKANFTEDEIVELGKVATLIDVDAGTKFTIEGTTGQQALFLIAGTASVVRDGKTIASLKPGDIIGEIALLTGEPRTATVIADEDATVYAMSPRDFNTLLARCPRLQARYTTMALRRVTEAV